MALFEKKIVTIVGNRPQFVKMAPLSRAIKNAGYKEVVIHTGQHVDPPLNHVFFEELEIKEPDYPLSVHEKTHGRMTAEILTQLEDLFTEIKPKNVIVYGDTNSTLAAALAAVKLGIKIAHVEAGPRTYDMRAPEEVNRVMTDHVATLLFCPDRPSVQNLEKENLTKGVHFVGDVMYDAFLQHQEKAAKASTLLRRHPLLEEGFVLLTLHRPSNVDRASDLERLLKLIQKIDRRILFPAHLRTLERMKAYGLYEAFKKQAHLTLTDPLGYFDILTALRHCFAVITDSGGLQKEAFFASKPCFVCLLETPWPELLESKWLVLLGTLDQMDLDKVPNLLSHFQCPSSRPPFFGDGHAAEKIVSLLEENAFFYEEAPL